MYVSVMGSSKSARVHRQPRDQFAHLGADGKRTIKHFLQRREPGSKVQQVLHRAHHKAPLCMRPQAGFQQAERPRPCVARTTYGGKDPPAESSEKGPLKSDGPV